MGGVFINYRIDDHPALAVAIDDNLTRRFGGDNVFRDNRSMQAGEDYPAELRAALERVDVLLCIIGPHWLTLTDRQTGEPRITREDDWVRREIATALRRGIHVVPVLLKDTKDGSAAPPTAIDLPGNIGQLANKQVFAFSQERFGPDLDRLASRLVRLVPTLAIPQLFAPPPSPWRPDNAPSTLLRAEYGMVEFSGRGRELADLHAWVAGPAASSAKLVIGSSGSGKTRLARELCAELSTKEGWLAGIVSGQAPAIQIGYTAAIDKPLLAVVDDVELRADQLVALAAAIGARSTVRDEPARLLLLGRSAGDWLKALQGNSDGRVAELFRTITDHSVIRLSPDTDDHNGQFNAACAAFAAKLGLPAPVEESLSYDGSASLLDVHTAALDSLLRATPGGRTTPSTMAVPLRHDRRHLRRLAREAGRADLDTGSLAAVCTLATLCRPDSDEQAAALRERLPDLLGGVADATVADSVEWLGRIYPGLYPLNALHPDSLGEHLVAATLAARPSIIVALGTTCTDDQVVNALTVLGRAMGRHRELAEAVAALIRVNTGRLIMLGIDAAGRLEEPEPFVRALAAAISSSRMSPDDAMSLLERLSTTGPALNPLKATAQRVFTDVVAKPMGELVHPSPGAEFAPFVATMSQLTDILQNAVQAFIDPGSGTMPKGPDGQDIVPAPLVELFRTFVIDKKWLRPPDERG